jgi:hypothetical protein
LEIFVNFLLLRYIVLLIIFALIGAGYSKFLKGIHHVYSPDHIDLTVVGGVLLIAVGGAITVLIGLTTWLSWFVYGGIALALGLPILRWQHQERQ